MRRIASLALLLLLLAAGCGEVPTALPVQAPTLAPDQFTVPLPPTVTPMPYPLPTRELFSPKPLPTATPPPVVPVLGAEWAPEAERETYVSTTVVVAPVGDGPGEIGYYRPPHTETLSIHAHDFTVDAHGSIYILDVVNQRVVEFDPQGHFVANIVYGDAVQGPGDLAVDAEGRVYIYEAAAYGPTPEEAVPKVKLFDPEGKLLWETPVPSWFTDRRILAMRVDEQGVLWVQGEAHAPNAPIIEGQPYPVEAVPLGNATGVLEKAQQRNNAVPGTMSSRGVYFSYSSLASDPLYLYDRQGRLVFACPLAFAGDIFVDQGNNIYLVSSNGANQTYAIGKYDPQGRLLASLELPLGTLQCDVDGEFYSLAIDWQTWATYYVVRAQHK